MAGGKGVCRASKEPGVTSAIHFAAFVRPRHIAVVGASERPFSFIRRLATFLVNRLTAQSPPYPLLLIWSFFNIGSTMLRWC